MIIVTNGKDKITLKKELLTKRENEYVLFSKNNFLSIELDFVIEDDDFTKIQKCYSSANGSGDILEEYKNRIRSNEEILLNNKDYLEVTSLIKNFEQDDIYRKETLIDIYSELLAYECFVNYVLEDIEDYKLEYIYNEYLYSDSVYRKEVEKYRKEIYAKANEKLKNKYKVNLDYVFSGGSKNE